MHEEIREEEEANDAALGSFVSHTNAVVAANHHGMPSSSWWASEEHHGAMTRPYNAQATRGSFVFPSGASPFSDLPPSPIHVPSHWRAAPFSSSRKLRFSSHPMAWHTNATSPPPGSSFLLRYRNVSIVQLMLSLSVSLSHAQETPERTALLRWQTASSLEGESAALFQEERGGGRNPSDGGRMRRDSDLSSAVRHPPASSSSFPHPSSTSHRSRILQSFFDPLLSHAIAVRRKDGMRVTLKALLATTRMQLQKHSPPEALLLDMLVEKMLGGSGVAAVQECTRAPLHHGMGDPQAVFEEEEEEPEEEEDVTMTVGEKLLYVILRTSAVIEASGPGHGLSSLVTSFPSWHATGPSSACLGEANNMETSYPSPPPLLSPSSSFSPSTKEKRIRLATERPPPAHVCSRRRRRGRGTTAVEEESKHRCMETGEGGRGRGALSPLDSSSSSTTSTTVAPASLLLLPATPSHERREGGRRLSNALAGRCRTRHRLVFEDGAAFSSHLFGEPVGGAAASSSWKAPASRILGRCWLSHSTITLVEHAPLLQRALRWSSQVDPVIHAALVPYSFAYSHAFTPSLLLSRTSRVVSSPAALSTTTSWPPHRLAPPMTTTAAVDDVASRAIAEDDLPGDIAALLFDGPSILFPTHRSAPLGTPSPSASPAMPTPASSLRLPSPRSRVASPSASPAMPTPASSLRLPHTFRFFRPTVPASASPLPYAGMTAPAPPPSFSTSFSSSSAFLHVLFRCVVGLRDPFGVTVVEEVVPASGTAPPSRPSAAWDVGEAKKTSTASVEPTRTRWSSSSHGRHTPRTPSPLLSSDREEYPPAAPSSVLVSAWPWSALPFGAPTPVVVATTARFPGVLPSYGVSWSSRQPPGVPCVHVVHHEGWCGTRETRATAPRHHHHHHHQQAEGPPSPTRARRGGTNKRNGKGGEQGDGKARAGGQALFSSATSLPTGPSVLCESLRERRPSTTDNLHPTQKSRTQDTPNTTRRHRSRPVASSGLLSRAMPPPVFSSGLLSLLQVACMYGTLLLRLERLCYVAGSPERQAGLGSYGLAALTALRHMVVLLRRQASDPLLRSCGWSNASASASWERMPSPSPWRTSDTSVLFAAFHALRPLCDTIQVLADIFGIHTLPSWDVEDSIASRLTSATLLSALYERVVARGVYGKMSEVWDTPASSTSSSSMGATLDVVGYLFRAVVQPFQQMLTVWLTKGQRWDRLDEFFIVPHASFSTSWGEDDAGLPSSWDGGGGWPWWRREESEKEEKEKVDSHTTRRATTRPAVRVHREGPTSEDEEEDEEDEPPYRVEPTPHRLPVFMTPETATWMCHAGCSLSTLHAAAHALRAWWHNLDPDDGEREEAEDAEEAEEEAIANAHPTTLFSSSTTTTPDVLPQRRAVEAFLHALLQEGPIMRDAPRTPLSPSAFPHGFPEKEASPPPFTETWGGRVPPKPPPIAPGAPPQKRKREPCRSPTPPLPPPPFFSASAVSSWAWPSLTERKADGGTGGGASLPHTVLPSSPPPPLSFPRPTVDLFFEEDVDGVGGPSSLPLLHPTHATSALSYWQSYYQHCDRLLFSSSSSSSSSSRPPLQRPPQANHDPLRTPPDAHREAMPEEKVFHATAERRSSSSSSSFSSSSSSSLVGVRSSRSSSPDPFATTHRGPSVQSYITIEMHSTASSRDAPREAVKEKASALPAVMPTDSETPPCETPTTPSRSSSPVSVGRSSFFSIPSGPPNTGRHVTLSPERENTDATAKGRTVPSEACEQTCVGEEDAHDDPPRGRWTLPRPSASSPFVTTTQEKDIILASLREKEAKEQVGMEDLSSDYLSACEKRVQHAWEAWAVPAARATLFPTRASSPLSVLPFSSHWARDILQTRWEQERQRGRPLPSTVQSPVRSVFPQVLPPPESPDAFAAYNRSLGLEGETAFSPAAVHRCPLYFYHLSRLTASYLTEKAVQVLLFPYGGPLQVLLQQVTQVFLFQAPGVVAQVMQWWTFHFPCMGSHAPTAGGATDTGGAGALSFRTPPSPVQDAAAATHDAFPRDVETTREGGAGVYRVHPPPPQWEDGQKRLAGLQRVLQEAWERRPLLPQGWPTSSPTTREGDERKGNASADGARRRGENTTLWLRVGLAPRKEGTTTTTTTTTTAAAEEALACVDDVTVEWDDAIPLSPSTSSLLWWWLPRTSMCRSVRVVWQSVLYSHTLHQMLTTTWQLGKACGDDVVEVHWFCFWVRQVVGCVQTYVWESIQRACQALHRAFLPFLPIASSPSRSSASSPSSCWMGRNASGVTSMQALTALFRRFLFLCRWSTFQTPSCHAVRSWWWRLGQPVRIVAQAVQEGQADLARRTERLWRAYERTNAPDHEGDSIYPTATASIPMTEPSRSARDGPPTATWEPAPTWCAWKAPGEWQRGGASSLTGRRGRVGWRQTQRTPRYGVGHDGRPPSSSVPVEKITHHDDTRSEERRRHHKGSAERPASAWNSLPAVEVTKGKQEGRPPAPHGYLEVQLEIHRMQRALHDHLREVVLQQRTLFFHILHAFIQALSAMVHTGGGTEEKRRDAARRPRRNEGGRPRPREATTRERKKVHFQTDDIDGFAFDLEEELWPPLTSRSLPDYRCGDLDPEKTNHSRSAHGHSPEACTPDRSHHCPSQDCHHFSLVSDAQCYTSLEVLIGQLQQLEEKRC